MCSRGEKTRLHFDIGGNKALKPFVFLGLLLGHDARPLRAFIYCVKESYGKMVHYGNISYGLVYK